MKKGGLNTEDAVNGVATFGRVSTAFISIFIIIIAIVFLVIGIVVVRKSPDVTVTTKKTTNGGITPSTNTETQSAPKWLGWVIIIISILIIILVVVWTYFVFTNRNVAAVAGVAGVVGAADAITD